jgi:hypothetical protein
MTREASIDRVIRHNLHRLRKPGVLTVRPGFELTRQQLTGRAAIVVTVHTKRSSTAIARADLLPEKIAGIPVDVREASAGQRLRAVDPLAARIAEAYGRPEEREPVWTLEREMPSGKRLLSPASDTHKALERARAVQPAANRALLAQTNAAARIPYVPADIPLQTTAVTATVTAHVSPDAGLVTLQAFLAGTRQSLIVGMYDFTSASILKSFLSDLTTPKTLQIVLDNPALNPTADQSDTQTAQDLQAALGGRSKIARALVRSDPYAAQWMFPSAYHIKLIVRDGNSIWLSSGNLNNSNQPDLSNPPRTEDRDWHIIIEHAGLAQTFAAYLNQDYASAAAHQSQSPESLLVLDTARSKLLSQANPVAPVQKPPGRSRRATATRVPARTFSNLSFEVTPLLTPDTLPPVGGTQGQYLFNITRLLQSARKSIYVQLQYIEASSGHADPYQALLQTIAERIKAGVDVRLIESAEYGLPWVEKMKSAGVDLSGNIRLQPNVHNKGFVVDSQYVVVSSQNFSPEGVRQNRDAGLILHSPELAAYFEPIFLADWTSARPASAAQAHRSPSRRSHPLV